MPDNQEPSSQNPLEAHQQTVIEANRQIAAYIKQNLENDFRDYKLPHHHQISSVELIHSPKNPASNMEDRQQNRSILFIKYKHTAPENYIVYRDPVHPILMGKSGDSFAFTDEGERIDGPTNGGYSSSSLLTNSNTIKKIYESLESNSQENRPRELKDNTRITTIRSLGGELIYLYELENPNWYELIYSVLDALHQEYPEQFPAFKDFVREQASKDTATDPTET